MLFKPKKRIIKELNEIIAEQAKDIDDLKEYKNLYEEEKKTTEIQNTVIVRKNAEIADLENRRRKAAGALGGYKKQLNKKDKKIEELEEKVKELSSGAYRRIQLKPQRVPKMPVKIKSYAKTSNISRKHRIEVEK